MNSFDGCACCLQAAAMKAITEKIASCLIEGHAGLICLFA
jgi:hypothetical protein